MTRRKKVLLAAFLVILLSQLPFVYRRYKLGKLGSAVRALNDQQRPSSISDHLQEIKGVAHVHSFIGGHSTGTFQAIIDAAVANDLDFVLMTEHPAANFDTASMTLKGDHAGIMFVNGNEVSTSTGDRLLLLPGDQQANRADRLTTQEVLSGRTAGSAFVAYPHDFRSWDAIGITGIEIYNVYTNAQKINPFVLFFDGLWSYRSYPDLLFASFYERPALALKKWDDEIARSGKQLVAIAGNDSHANVGISLNDSAGNSLLGLQLDPYERSFRLVRLHVLVSALIPYSRDNPLDADAVLTAIARGRCFIGFDLFGDTTGFRFWAVNSAAEMAIMGDSINLQGGVRLKVEMPIPGRVLVFKNGVEIHSQAGTQLEFPANEKGVYRIEVYLPQLPHPVREQPWIISNPIYVR